MKNLFYFIILLFITLNIKSYSQTLRPGDGLKLIFFNITDSISGDYYIQDDGTISLPYLGKIVAAGVNTDSLKTEIYSKYSSLYKNPELTILPLIRVNIFGEVKTPGFYYVTGTDKLSDLIAKAGGTTTEADLSDIVITRNGKEIQINGNKVIESGSKLDDIGLQSGDQIDVTRKWFSGTTSTIIISAVGIVASLIVALFYRGIL
jgi:protein involved in polysaccharide export with SLBB domain